MLRHLKAENSALRVKIQKIERDSSASSPKNKTGGSKFINSEASGTLKKNLKIMKNVVYTLCHLYILVVIIVKIIFMT